MSEVYLAAITQPVAPQLDTAEHFITYAARVSNPSNQANKDTAPKLLQYLLKNKHWSPFEMAHVVLEINTTRDIARQILRHRSFSFQEFSQRYANAEELGFEFREARLQDTKNRQNSLEVPINSQLSVEWKERQQEHLDNTKELYKWALDNGIAKEQARAVLPEGMTRSRLFMAGTLRSWLHYCSIRMDKSTQKEHREVAEKCFRILENEFPSIKGILNDI